MVLDFEDAKREIAIEEVMVLSLAQGQKERRENLLGVIALIWSDYRRGPILLF